MIIIGGTYKERCFEPLWDNIFGSGLRAVNLLLECDVGIGIEYYTCCDEETKNHLSYYQNQYKNLEVYGKQVFDTPQFYYDHPLSTPIISPRPDFYCNSVTQLEAKGEKILVFGMLEAGFQIEGKKVVYDPQSPVNPQLFSTTGSTAQQLVIIINYSEAKSMSGSDNIDDIIDFFFNQENCFALIIKMGAKGAYLFENETTTPVKIPIYQTNHIWTIGSGDIYTTYFSYNWFQGNTLLKSAINASKATAVYSNSRSLSISNELEQFQFPELIINEIPKNQVYLAGPFFTFSERWLINEIWVQFKHFGLKVFSPFHDVGLGTAQEVVPKDIKGIDDSKVIFAVVDGLDSGTLFEIGYAIAQNKKVIAFVQNESEESLKMLEGTNCIIENDLTTAIYKTYWNLADTK